MNSKFLVVNLNNLFKLFRQWYTYWEGQFFFHRTCLSQPVQITDRPTDAMAVYTSEQLLYMHAGTVEWPWIKTCLHPELFIHMCCSICQSVTVPNVCNEICQCMALCTNVNEPLEAELEVTMILKCRRFLVKEIKKEESERYVNL